jgi:hypothetical protein
MFLRFLIGQASLWQGLSSGAAAFRGRGLTVRFWSDAVDPAQEVA